MCPYRLKYVRAQMPVLAHMISGLPLGAGKYFRNINADFDTDPANDILCTRLAPGHISVYRGTPDRDSREILGSKKYFFAENFDL